MSTASISLRELADALMLLGAGEGFEAYVCLDTGHVHIVGDDMMPGVDEEPVPDDLETSDRYLQMPDKRELGLGRTLALAFIDAEAPDDYDRVRDYFSHRGAYARFKDLLDHRNLLDHWHACEQEAETAALRAWCEENGLIVTD